MSDKQMTTQPAGVDDLMGDIEALLEASRRTTTRALNAIMTATYWEIGRRIVEFNQRGAERAQYGEELLKRLSERLTKRFGRGFSRHNLARFRHFYLVFSPERIGATPSLESEEGAGSHKGATLSRQSAVLHGDTLVALTRVAEAFPLPWSHYVALIRLRSEEAIRFYHAEALRGGWSVRQLKRQINSQFYERTALSWDKAAMLQNGQSATDGAEAVLDELVAAVPHGQVNILTARRQVEAPFWEWWSRLWDVVELGIDAVVEHSDG